MQYGVIESQYPISFRAKDAEMLGKHLQNRHSVVLIGMKRVGISNFLRFFLYHKSIVAEYISKTEKHLFIPVDLNDLVEKEIFPFWTLTLKRIVDSIESSLLDVKVKKYAEKLFLDSIQSQDLFMTIDSVRSLMNALVEKGVMPTLFFLRFDRMKDAATPEFFANLQGLRDAAHQKLAYVFTSFRSLDKLSSQVFTRASLSVFAQDIYIKPAMRKDAQIILKTYKNRSKLNLDTVVEQELFDNVDGYIQYLQLALIILQEQRGSLATKPELFEILTKDERMSLQSEELWESLDSIEQGVLQKVSRGFHITSEDKKRAEYLWDTGFIAEHNGRISLFTPIFDYYLKLREKDSSTLGIVSDFTKKENKLFGFLQERIGEICEREKIVESVWPEVEAFGVSDWAIDRLVARVRSKLRMQKSTFEIQTIKTRGYKLIKAAR